jgi:hypothetical protein
MHIEEFYMNIFIIGIFWTIFIILPIGQDNIIGFQGNAFKAKKYFPA